MSHLDGAVVTSQGFLRAPAVLTRTGVLKYKQANGQIRRELRLPEEVFKSDSLATLSLAPLTNEHPKEAVTPENVKEFQVGNVGENITHDDTFVRGVVVVQALDAIADVQAGKVEISTGYNCKLEESPGVYNGEEYDVIQRDIVYNHVCITKLGRAGPEVRLRLDSDDAIQQTKEIPMEKITINGVEFEVTPELKAAYEAQCAKMAQDSQVKMDEVKAAEAAALKKAEEEKAASVVKQDELQARVDSLEEKLSQRTDSAEDFDKKVQERIEVLKVAGHVLNKDSADLKGKTNVELKKEVIAQRSKVDLTGKSEAYISARFDSIAEELDGEIKETENTLKAFETRLDSRYADSDSDAARERQKQRSLNASKTTTENK